MLLALAAASLLGALSATLLLLGALLLLLLALAATSLLGALSATLLLLLLPALLLPLRALLALRAGVVLRQLHQAGIGMSRSHCQAKLADRQRKSGTDGQKSSDLHKDSFLRENSR